MPKDKIINFKIEESIKQQFEEACKQNYEVPSQVLYKFVRNYINQNEGCKIPISKLRKQA